MRRLIVTLMVLLAILGGVHVIDGVAQSRQAGVPRGDQDAGAKAALEAIQDLQKEVKALRADVDYLLGCEEYDEDEIGCLQRLVDTCEQSHRMVLALYHTGRRGGEAWKESQLRFEMSIAKARLAWAKGDLRECENHCKAAEQAAQQHLGAVQAAYDDGQPGFETVLRAQSQHTNIRLVLKRLRKRIARMELRRIDPDQSNLAPTLLPPLSPAEELLNAVDPTSMLPLLASQFEETRPYQGTVIDQRRELHIVKVGPDGGERERHPLPHDAMSDLSGLFDKFRERGLPNGLYRIYLEELGVPRRKLIEFVKSNDSFAGPAREPGLDSNPMPE